jgi:hypothetical protein
MPKVEVETMVSHKGRRSVVDSSSTRDQYQNTIDGKGGHLGDLAD